MGSALLGGDSGVVEHGFTHQSRTICDRIKRTNLIPGKMEVVNWIKRTCRCPCTRSSSASTPQRQMIRWGVRRRSLWIGGWQILPWVWINVLGQRVIFPNGLINIYPIPIHLHSNAKTISPLELVSKYSTTLNFNGRCNEIIIEIINSKSTLEVLTLMTTHHNQYGFIDKRFQI